MYLQVPVAPIRILGIDPGVNTLGVSVIEFTPGLPYRRVLAAFTIKTASHVDDTSTLVENFGVRQGKLRYIFQQLYSVLMDYQPSAVVAEAPFMGKFAKSYEVLVEVRDAIKAAVMAWNPGLFFETIEPLNVKMAVGMKLTKENRRDKSAVKNHLAMIPTIIWPSGRSIHHCDEHTVDAVAVAYWKIEIIEAGFRMLDYYHSPN